jgi:hypothetical protein
VPDPVVPPAPPVPAAVLLAGPVVIEVPVDVEALVPLEPVPEPSPPASLMSLPPMEISFAPHAPIDRSTKEAKAVETRALRRKVGRDIASSSGS